MHSARLIAHQSEAAALRGGEDESGVTNEMMLVVQVLWRSSQVKLLQHLFTSDLFNVVLGAQMWEKLRHKSIRTLKEKEKPRETLKKRFPLTDGCESESLSPCTFKLSSAIWANRAATEVRWRNAGDFGQNRAIWWEWGADMRKLKMKKKNLVRNIHSERNWCEKGLQVSSGNGFYSAQNNKERPSHWKRHKERDDDIGWVRGPVVLTAPLLSSPLKIPGQT